MDGPRLSPRERRILAELEEDLRRGDLAPDPHTGRTGRSGHPSAGRARRAGRRPSGRVLVVLGVVSLALLVLGIATEKAALIWAFTAVWVLTLIWLMRLVIRWTRRLQNRGSDDGR
ncbi:DUF3040 domain-containing protein [Streptomyces sp. NPDC058745]|uniref:DUF3040 domain-containing protein n=1 Tax=Streptomyces sp. NPDC058745 TaxID=3346621 RepID=UPI00369ECC1E